jgi:hypothetical protein
MATRKATEQDRMRALKPLMERTAADAVACSDIAWELNMEGIARCGSAISLARCATPVSRFLTRGSRSRSRRTSRRGRNLAQEPAESRSPSLVAFRERDLSRLPAFKLCALSHHRLSPRSATSPLPLVAPLLATTLRGSYRTRTYGPRAIRMGFSAGMRAHTVIS